MKLLLFILFFCGQSQAWAGNFVNNGIDQLDDKSDAVWFVGARDINACVEVDQNFGVTRDEAFVAIERAFATWANYFQQKGLDRILQKEKLEISTKVNLHFGCLGNEDVGFYLGSKNNFLIQAALGFRHPIAFSERTSYDNISRRGKGFVWVAPPTDFQKEKLDWSRDNHLLGALLHEIGHIYGCGHIGATIMRAELGENILDTKDDFLNVLTQIDSGKQLYLCSLCAGTFEGVILHNEVVTRLVGTKLGENIEANLTLKYDANQLPHGILKITDGKKSFDLNFSAYSEIADVLSDTLLFHVPVSSDASRKESFATRHLGQVYLATLTFENRRVNLIYKRNMDAFYSVKAPYADQLVLVDPKFSNNSFLFLTPKQ